LRRLLLWLRRQRLLWLSRWLRLQSQWLQHLKFRQQLFLRRVVW
jgi:hypothetical protein